MVKLNTENAAWILNGKQHLNRYRILKFLIFKNRLLYLGINIFGSVQNWRRHMWYSSTPFPNTWKFSILNLSSRPRIYGVLLFTLYYHVRTSVQTHSDVVNRRVQLIDPIAGRVNATEKEHVDGQKHHDQDHRGHANANEQRDERPTVGHGERYPTAKGVALRVVVILEFRAIAGKSNLTTCLIKYVFFKK